jgi:predicted nuclease of restriction endonuclease-like RecB superfamily
MLTKNLLKARIIDSVLKPTFLTKKNALGWDACAALVELSNTSSGVSYSKFKKLVSEAGMSLNPYVQGLLKVLKDKFVVTEDIDFEELRWKIIKASESERVNARSYDEFRENLSDRLGIDFSELKEKIYGDLDEEAPIKFSDNLSHENLISQYNLALAQGFLVKAEDVLIEVKAHSSDLKPLFARIKFLGLFIEDLKISDGGLARFTVSGPLSVIESSRAYGIKFIGVLSILTEYECWSLKANIVHNGKNAELALNEKSPIHSGKIAKRKSDFVPENLVGFIDLFNNKNLDWKVEPGCEIVNFGKEELCFPDLIVKSLDGQKRYVELFNKWNKKALMNRLDRLQDCANNDVILGIDRSLAKDKKISKKIEKSSEFQKVGFLYRDVPSSKALKSLLGNN